MEKLLKEIHSEGSSTSYVPEPDIPSPSVEELIPESQTGGFADAATMGAIGGFTVMMVLDVALG